MAYDNRNRGSIWKNEKKQTETHPDFTGTYTDENNVEYWVSAWKRKPDASDKAPALSFSLKRKEATQGVQNQPGRDKPAKTSDYSSDPFGGPDEPEDGSRIPF